MDKPLIVKVYRNSELVATETFDRDIIKIGRLSSAHLRLEDEKVSRIHAVVEVSASGEINIIDMGSAEGTFVNGEKVNKATLKPGDEIRVGETRLVLQLEGAPAAEAAAVATPPAAEATALAPAAQPAAETAPLSPEAAAAPESYSVPDLGEETSPDEEPTRQEEIPVRPTPRMEAQAAPSSEPPAVSTRRVALPPPKELGELHDDESVGGKDWALEVRQMWGSTVLEVRAYRSEQKQVVVGEQGKVDFFAPADVLPSATFPIATLGTTDATIYFGGSATGDLRKADGTVTLLSEVGRGGSLTLPQDAVATVVFGQLGFRFRYVSKPAGYLSKMSDRVDYTFLNTVLLLLFVYAGMIATFQLRPKAVDTSEEELYKVPDRFVQFILTRPKPEKKDLTFLEKLKSDINDKQDSAPRYKGQEGKMGKPGMPDTGKRSAVRAIKPDDKEIVGNRGLLAVLGAGGPQGLSTVMGGTGLGGEMEGAIGGMFGSQIGDSGGFGGLGLKGTGTGGGGMGNTIGVGGLGTRGRGGGQYGYGTGVARIRDRGERNVNISVGQPIIMGSLSMEIIRQVVHSHHDQIKYCYSQELTRNPNLQGKVAVKWTISPKGYVTQTNVSQTTLNNAAVESCICQKIKTWKFPEPKGGGIVIVNYPFILASGG